MQCFFFFFKQKTAYEMRISDWSSDVCSSDLNASRSVSADPGVDITRASTAADPVIKRQRLIIGYISKDEAFRFCKAGQDDRFAIGEAGNTESTAALPTQGQRSEEHTSELQSLMRISYAVFCLKKKKKTNH